MTLITSNLNRTLERHLEINPPPQRVDIISSYIRKEGIDVVWPVFEVLEEKGARIRIISTFNRKITDVESIERPAKLKNTEVYIFEPSRVNFHAKTWFFGYANRDLDTAIIGSSNLTGRGVVAAVEWNVLLQRCKHRDASGAIDYAEAKFSWYLEEFKAALIKWDLNMPDYQGYRAAVQRHLTTDQELIQQARPEVQARWIELNAELEKLMQAERDKVQLKSPPSGVTIGPICWELPTTPEPVVKALASFCSRPPLRSLEPLPLPDMVRPLAVGDGSNPYLPDGMCPGEREGVGLGVNWMLKHPLSETSDDYQGTFRQ